MAETEGTGKQPETEEAQPNGVCKDPSVREVRNA
jgi:hypothetical protein